MKATIIIPAYNEARTVRTLLARVLASPIDLEVVAVDDGSSDGTREALEQIAREDPRVRVAIHPANRGKGASIKTAIPLARGEVVLIQDADLEYDPADYPKLLGPIADGRADVVFGSRFIGSEPHRVLYYWHSVANRALTTASNMLTNLNLTDMEVGLKAFRREVLASLPLREEGFGFEPEVTARVARARCRVFEVGVSYTGRTYAEGKKIRWTDGVRALACILRYNLFA